MTEYLSTEIKPFFSIIIPMYNREKYIVECLDSIAAQIFKNYEIIVIDDNSSDSSIKLVEDYPHEIILLKNSSNMGPAYSRQQGLNEAQGQYITLLDSDDQWFPWTLEVFAKIIEQTNKPSIVSLRCTLLNSEKPLTNEINIPDIKFIISDDYYKFKIRYPEEWIPFNPIAISRKTLLQGEGYNTDLNALEDFDFLLRHGIFGNHVLIDTPLMYKYRLHEGNQHKQNKNLRTSFNIILKSEQKGYYPGGKEKQKERWNLITIVFRHEARMSILYGNYKDAFYLYIKMFHFNLKLKRFKFIFGLPIYFLVFFLKKHLSV